MSPTKPPPDQASGSSAGAKVFGYTAVVAVLAGYFAWVCLQMATHVFGGDTLLLELIIGIGASAIALLAGVAGRRRSAARPVADLAPPSPAGAHHEARTRPAAPRPRVRGPQGRPTGRVTEGRTGAARRTGRAPERSGRR